MEGISREVRTMLRGFLTGFAGMLTVGVLAGSPVAVPEDYRLPFEVEGKPLEGLVITLDPGHGGSSFSPGYSGSARGINSRVVEGDLNMRVAGLLYHHLKDAGAEVHLTRRDDRKVVAGDSGRSEELGARTALAERTRSHLFLSLHHNSAPRETADGVMLLIYPIDKAGNEQPLERAFAEILTEEVAKTVHQTEPFSPWENDHPLVSGSDLPSAVVEFGFLSNPEFDAWVTRPTAHKDEAIGAYNGVVRMWQEHREELETLRERVLPEEESAKPAESGSDAFPLGKPAAAMWRSDRPVATEQEAEFAVETLRNSYVTDRTSVWWRADVDASSEPWTLRVTTNLTPAANWMAEQLGKAAAREITLELKPLPSEAVLPDPFGVVTAPMALTWGEPAEGRWVQSQVLYGEPLFLLDRTESGDYYLVQGADGYAGWLRADGMKTLSRDDFAAMMASPGNRVAKNIMDDDFRIPPGSFVGVEEMEGGLLRVQRGGEEDPVVEQAAVRLAGEPSPGRIAVETALREFLYVPYVFGGRSPQGLDCSGLVGSCWAAAGVQLPRDANQQAIAGRLVGTPEFEEGLAPGDILLFVDKTGRVIHAGLSLGGSFFVHASPPEVQINSLDPEEELYSRTWHEAFWQARRPAE